VKRQVPLSKTAKDPVGSSSAPLKQIPNRLVELKPPGRRVEAPTSQPEVQPDVRFVEEKVTAKADNDPASAELNSSCAMAQDELNGEVNRLLRRQEARIAQYRRGADQREMEARQRESEAQQRKREGIQRARAALLREQVIEEREKDEYQVSPPGQREADARTRAMDSRQKEADRYQGVLDQRQRETDQWQREFDDNAVAAMRKETQHDIAVARSRYQKRVAELIADDSNRKREASDAAAFSQAEFKIKAGSGLHNVRTASGLSFAVPDGYEVTGVRTIGKGSYSVTLKPKKP
jgi:hypothetical protein